MHILSQLISDGAIEPNHEIFAHVVLFSLFDGSKNSTYKQIFFSIPISDKLNKEKKARTLSLTETE